MFFFDSTMLLLVPALILAFYAQAKVKSTYARYSKVASARGLTGVDVAKRLLGDAGIENVSVSVVPGTLNDHYDPRKKVVNLSEAVARSRSVAAVGVAAHEIGHAMQHARGYLPLNLRNSLVPVAQLGSGAAFPLFFIGFLFRTPFLMDLGIIFFAGAVLFQLVTLPVELNASRQALKALSAGGYLVSNEVDKTRRVLNAAALTYIAAAAMAALQLIRLIILRGDD